MAVYQKITGLVAFLVSAMLLLATYYRTNLFLDMGGPGRPSASSEPDGHKPRYFFIDLGANRGDSLDVFLQHSNAKFQYDFPRPDWATHDQAAKEECDALGIKLTIFPSTVVDVRDGTRTFFLDTVNNANDFWGSSIYSNHPDAVKSKSNGTELSAINISRWLLMNTRPRDFVVVKMDVESAEYELIPHMAEMSVWTVVDVLLVEWHGGVAEEGMAERATKAAEKLGKEGIEMPVYDSPA